MVELMVALVLALLVADAAISLFLANKKTASTTSGVAAISDNGRFALNLIEQSVRSGGYLGCSAMNAGSTLTTPLNPPERSDLAAGATPVQNNFDPTKGAAAFGGYEASATGPTGAATVPPMPVTADTNAGHWTNALDALLTANSVAVPGVVTGTDVLVVREQLPTTVTMYTAAPYAGGNLLTVNDASSLAGLKLPHTVVVSSCGTSEVLQLTGVAGNVLAFANALTIGVPVGSSEVAPVDTLIYYIGPGRDGDGALYVWDDGSDPATPFSVELVPDVESMQVLYGIAPNTPNSATAYETADVVAGAKAFNQVVGVKVALLLASPPQVGAVPVPTAAPTFSLLGATITAPIDNRLRKVFDVTIAARNTAL